MGHSRGCFISIVYSVFSGGLFCGSLLLFVCLFVCLSLKLYFYGLGVFGRPCRRHTEFLMQFLESSK